MLCCSACEPQKQLQDTTKRAALCGVVDSLCVKRCVAATLWHRAVCFGYEAVSNFQRAWHQL